MSHFCLPTSASHGTLQLAIVWLVCTLHLQWWSFHICHSEYLSDISWRVMNLFHTVTIYLFLISLSVLCVILTVYFLFLCRLRCIFAVNILWSEDAPLKEEYASQFRVLFIHLFMIIKSSCDKVLFGSV